MASAPLRVLIADDSAPVAEMLTELIAVPGRIEVVGVADSVASAVDSVRALEPHVLILDLELKGGSGTNVIKAIRADASLSPVRIVVTSNHTSPRLRAGCLELGAERYFDKVKELGALSAFLLGIAPDQ